MATTLTLRPNAGGDESLCYYYLSGGDSGSGAFDKNWRCVDEAVADEDTTYVSSTNSNRYDLYNIPNHTTESGIINHITVFARCRCESAPQQASLAIRIKSDGVTTEDDWVWVTTSYDDYSKQWVTNPADAGAWEWADIDALQIGVRLRVINPATDYTRCTQVYVVVDYSPPGGGGAGAAVTGTKSLILDLLLADVI